MSLPPSPPAQSSGTPRNVVNGARGRLSPSNHFYHADHGQSASDHLLPTTTPPELVSEAQQQRAQRPVTQPVQLQHQQHQQGRRTEEEEEREDDDADSAGSHVGPSDSQAAAVTQSQDATNTNGDKAPKRKRRRQAINCAECRRRKIKCDRQQPCGPCLRQGIVCKFVVIEPFEISVTRPEYDEIRRKIAYLEMLIVPLTTATAAMGSTPVPVNTAAPAPVPISYAPYGSVGPHAYAYYYNAAPQLGYHYGTPPPPPTQAASRKRHVHGHDSHHPPHHAYPTFPPQEHMRRKVSGSSLTPANACYQPPHTPPTPPPPPPPPPPSPPLNFLRHVRDTPSPPSGSPGNNRSRPLQSTPPRHYKPFKRLQPNGDSEPEQPATPRWTTLRELSGDERERKRRRRVDAATHVSPLPSTLQPRSPNEVPKPVAAN